MAPIQANGLGRLSPVLSQILEEIGGGQPGARQTSNAIAVAKLSRLFTKDRQGLGTDYLHDPCLANAYVSYFLPVNLSKIQVLFDELPQDWPRPAEYRPCRVLDLGTGPGTGALAVLDWLNEHDPGSLDKLSIVGVDVSSKALSQARLLWSAYCRQVGMSEGSLTLYEGDLSRPLKKGWQHEVLQRRPYDVIILANCLNELYVGTQDPTKERSRFISDLLTLLAPHGTLMIIEPALRETSRALHQVRDALLQAKQCTVYSPCLHEGNCPALLNPDDWCHEERAWEAPAWIRQIDRQVGFIKDALKFSYLLLRTDGRTITPRSPETFRMVSELRKLKGDTRAWLCNELGRPEVGRLDRAQSDSNASWDRCQRGTIVRIEGITRKDGASLARIPDDASVHIVRSA
jgi:ribosomal protein RSM22 (predicted rRNA methylase)